MSLIRIGESLHCHIPSVQSSARRWLCGDALDREAGERHLLRLVRQQVGTGASYLDVNVDNFLSEDGIGADGAREILSHVFDLIHLHGDGVPPCVDSSDPSLLDWALRDYMTRIPNPGVPLVNSVNVSRLELLELRRDFTFSVVGMLLERAGESQGFTDIAGPEVYHDTAMVIFEQAKLAGFKPEEIFFDPTVGPLGADMVGYTRRTFEGIRIIRTDADMAGVHVVLGLSNCSDGLPRRLAINRAYLRVAIEFGVDAAILDVGQVTGEDLVDGRILKLIRKVAEGETLDTLPLLVDYAQAHPHGARSTRREALPDTFSAQLRDPDKPVYVLEMAPAEGNGEEILELAEKARDTPFTLTLTDTPGGRRAPGPDALAVEVARIMDRQPIVNLSCKSDDRNGLVQRVLSLYERGLRHFFAVTGDYPTEGRANYDLDSVTLLMTMDALRRGLEFPSLLPRGGGALEGMMAGAAVSPFKYLEADVWGQYLKMWKKRQCGADYFITQLGFDVAKFQELKLWMRRCDMADVPVIGMVYFLTPQVLKVLNRVHVAGVVIPEDVTRKFRGALLPKAERSRLRKMGFVELAEYQHRFAIRRAALLGHILLDGLDYKGLDLAGITDIADALEIVDTIEQLQQGDWRASWEEYREGDGDVAMRFAEEDGFYLFPPNGDSLLQNGPYLRADRSDYAKADRGMTWLHRRFFEGDDIGHSLLKWLAGGPEDGARLQIATLAEQFLKGAALGCEMCGDCRIADLQYRCPEPTNGCAKHLLNGPCGGADVRGMCEVHPERRCYWGGVYEAALSANALEELTKIQPPKDPTLQHTSSWRNHLLDRGPEPLPRQSMIM